MSDLNKAQIIGRFGNDPETKQTNGGKSVVNARIATNHRYKDREGEQVESTEWHNVTFYAGLADIVAKYMKSGSRAYVEGRLKTSKWTDSSGFERYTTEIVATDLQMLDK